MRQFILRDQGERRRRNRFHCLRSRADLFHLQQNPFIQEMSSERKRIIKTDRDYRRVHPCVSSYLLY